MKHVSIFISNGKTLKLLNNLYNLLWQIGRGKFTPQLVNGRVFKPSTETSVSFKFSTKIPDHGTVGYSEWPSSHYAIPNTFHKLAESLPSASGLTTKLTL